MAWAACGKAEPGGDGRGLEGAVLLAAVAPAVLAGRDRDAPPGQVLDLGVQARLVLLHDQDVVRLLFRDQELGVLALGVQRVGGDDAPGQVQRLEQRREPGDLVGLAVHPDLAEHSTTALIEGGQQVYRLAVGAGMTGAPHRLAVHRHRPPGRRACPAAWPAACSRASSQDPTAASSASASAASSTRRMVASSGGTNRRVSGSQRTPRAARTCGGASATHSPTAVNDVAPASTAATAAINNEVRLCRTPRGSRGSGTRARYSARPGHWPDSSARSLAGRRESCSRAALMP